MALKGKIMKNKGIVDSFRNAFKGLFFSFTVARNLIIDLGFLITVVIGGIFFKISYTEWLVCLVFIGLVISLEMVNTAIEETVDLITKEYSELAKHAKDVSAGAVLFSAIVAFIVGCVIFLPKVIAFIGGLL